MSEWNRGGRQDEQRRYGFEQRREGRDEDRWSQAQRGEEQRSFEDRSRGGRQAAWWPDEPDRGQRGYGDDRRRAGQEFGGGATERQDDRRQDYRGRGYGGEAYGQGGQRFSQTGFGPQDEELQRISDGDSERGFGGAFFDRDREGEHRGRGPKNYTRSDERIREDVNDRLSDDSWLDASEIEVQVSQCEVTLTGTVNRREDKRHAEDIAERVSGVKHVQNNLRVQQQASAPTGNRPPPVG